MSERFQALGGTHQPIEAFHDILVLAWTWLLLLICFDLVNK